jgi:hypothetical protein
VDIVLYKIGAPSATDYSDFKSPAYYEIVAKSTGDSGIGAKFYLCRVYDETSRSSFSVKITYFIEEVGVRTFSKVFCTSFTSLIKF